MNATPVYWTPRRWCSAIRNGRPGVIGIVASRLVELYHRPALLISAPPGQNGRGSARSIEGINITSAIAANQQLLLGFGGHPMAAGFGIDPQKIPEFRRGLGRAIETATKGEMPVFELPVEAYLSLGDISLELVEALERLAPFGPGNPALILSARNLTLQSSSMIGKTGEHLQLIVEDSTGVSKRVVWWQGARAGLPEGPFDLAYSLRSSNYRGLPEVQVEWIDARPIQGSLADLVTQAIEVLDYRDIEDPRSALERLLKEKDLVIWSEGGPAPDAAAVDRYHLHIAGTLVVWNIPPGRRELQQAIQAVIPRRVALFNANAVPDQPGEFLKRLAGLVRFSLKNRQGARNHRRTGGSPGTAPGDRPARAGLAGGTWFRAHPGGRRSIHPTGRRRPGRSRTAPRPWMKRSAIYCKKRRLSARIIYAPTRWRL